MSDALFSLSLIVTTRRRRSFQLSWISLALTALWGRMTQSSSAWRIGLKMLRVSLSMLLIRGAKEKPSRWVRPNTASV